MAAECRTLTFFDDEEDIIFKYIGGDIFETLENIGKAILEISENEEDLTLENLMYRVIGKLAFFPEDDFYILAEESEIREMSAEYEDNSEFADSVDNDDADNDEYDDIDSNDDNIWANYKSIHTGINPDYSNFIK